MKLKKIASLMPAGVMAVSMLAGCATTSVDPEPTPNPDENKPSTTNYAALLQEDLEDVNVLKLKGVENNELNKALQAAVGYVGNNAVTDEFLDTLNDGRVRYVYSTGNWGCTNLAMGTVNNKLRDAMDPEVTQLASASETVRHLSPESKDNACGQGCLTGYTRNNVNTTLLFVVDRGVSIEAAIDEIADEIVDGVKGLNTAYDHIDSLGDTYNYEYTASVAVTPYYFDAMHGIGVNFIAVDIVRSITY